MSTVPFLVFRVLQIVILLAGIGSLVYGGWRLYDELRFRTTSVPALGEVVAFREERYREREGGFGPMDTRSRGQASSPVSDVYPIVRFRSPVDGRLHRSTSSIGYRSGGPALGAKLSIRASTRDVEDARQPDLVRRFLVPGVVLVLGLMGTLLPVLLWHMPDPDFDPAAGMSLFRSVSPAKGAAVLAVLAAVALAVYRFLPWARPEVLVLLATDSPRLARAIREPPPEAGRLLGATEGAVVKLPFVGAGAATSVVLSAIQGERHADLKRYMAAYRDPAIRLPLELGRVRYFTAAARAGDAEAIRILAESGLDPRADRAALGAAVESGRPAIVRLLASLGVTPADAAARRELVEYALASDDDDTLLALTELGWVDAGESFEGRSWGAGERGSVLDVALARGLVRSSRALELRGGVTSAPLLARLVAADLEEMRALVPEREWRTARVFGVPLLSFAARAGHLAVVRRLVDLGADPSAVATIDPGTPSLTPLEEAVRRGHVEVVRFLAGLPGAKAAYLGGPAGAAAVGEASRRGRWDLVRALVDAGGTPKASYTDPDAGGAGATPLHRAAWDGNLEAVEYLLAHGADPRAEADRRVLPIELARDDGVRAALVKAGGEP